MITSYASEEQGRIAHGLTFEIEIKSFKNKAPFNQMIKAEKQEFRISAEIEFMSCNDSQCLNGNSELKFPV